MTNKKWKLLPRLDNIALIPLWTSPIQEKQIKDISGPHIPQII